MSRTVRSVIGAVAVLLLVWLLVLLFRGPHFTADNADGPDVHVACGSIAAIGWPSDGPLLDVGSGGSYDDHADLPDGPADVYDAEQASIARDCTERRETYLGFMVLQGVAISLLGGSALRPAPRRSTAATPA